MLELYANQTLSWQHVTSISDTNQPTFGTAASIKGRKESSIKKVLNADGEEVLSNAQILTVTAVSEGDKVDGHIVVAVKDAVALDGSILFWEVFL